MLLALPDHLCRFLQQPRTFHSSPRVPRGFLPMGVRVRPYTPPPWGRSLHSLASSLHASLTASMWLSTPALRGGGGVQFPRTFIIISLTLSSALDNPENLLPPLAPASLPSLSVFIAGVLWLVGVLRLLLHPPCYQFNLIIRPQPCILLFYSSNCPVCTSLQS